MTENLQGSGEDVCKYHSEFVSLSLSSFSVGSSRSLGLTHTKKTPRRTCEERSIVLYFEKNSKQEQERNLYLSMHEHRESSRIILLLAQTNEDVVEQKGQPSEREDKVRKTPRNRVIERSITLWDSVMAAAHAAGCTRGEEKEQGPDYDFIHIL